MAVLRPPLSVVVFFRPSPLQTNCFFNSAQDLLRLPYSFFTPAPHFQFSISGQLPGFFLHRSLQLTDLAFYFILRAAFHIFLLILRPAGLGPEALLFLPSR